MTWHQYISCFFAGAFLANFVPHFVKGVCGDRFPTPFAKPPGKGLSSPTVNVVWALVNLVIGCVLLRIVPGFPDNAGSTVIFFVGAAALSILMSVQFANKQSS